MRPYDAKTLRQALSYRACQHSTGDNALDGWYLRAGSELAPAFFRNNLWQLSKDLKAVAGDLVYREVLTWLTGYDTLADVNVAMFQALWDWAYTRNGNTSYELTSTAKSEFLAVYVRANQELVVRRGSEWWRTGENSLDRLLADAQQVELGNGVIWKREVHAMLSKSALKTLRGWLFKNCEMYPDEDHYTGILGFGYLMGQLYVEIDGSDVGVTAVLYEEGHYPEVSRG